MENSKSCLPHLKRKSRLLVVNSDKDFTHYQLFTVIRKHKFCTEAVVTLSLFKQQTTTETDTGQINEAIIYTQLPDMRTHQFTL